MDWQPIETAPRDGTEILLWDGRSVEIGFWHNGKYPNDDLYPWEVRGGQDLMNGKATTHWMPLPEPPKAT